MKHSFVIVLLCFLISSCLSPVPSKLSQRFLLEKVNHEKTSGQATPLTILISRTSANPGYRGEEMLYINKRYQLKAFTHNSWVAPPAQMLTTLLVESLRNTGYYHAVLPLPYAGLTDRRLDTQLINLHQEFDGKKSRIRLTIQATLIDNRQHKILASQTFSTHVDSEAANPYGGVVAANQASAKLLRKIAAFAVNSNHPSNKR